jgi:hypothetical protein
MISGLIRQVRERSSSSKRCDQTASHCPGCLGMARHIRSPISSKS